MLPWWIKCPHQALKNDAKIDATGWRDSHRASLDSLPESKHIPMTSLADGDRYHLADINSEPINMARLL